MDQRLQSALRLLSVLALMLVVYLPVLSYGYAYEDHHGIYLEQARQAPSGTRIASAIVAPGGRMVSLVSFAWSRAWFGSSPRHFHVENVLLHAINGLLLYAVAARLFGSTAGLISAGIFWLHPVQIESVAYISSRTELVMACGILATLWCLLRRTRWIAMGSAFVVGLLTLSTKEVAVCLVSLVPLFCWWSGAVRWTVWLPIVAAWKALLAFALWQSTSAWLLFDRLGSFVWFKHVSQQVAALGQLLKLIVWPVGLSVDHDFSVISLAQGLSALLVLFGVAIVLWNGRHVRPTLAFLGAWIVVALLPRILLPSNPGMTEFLTEHHLLVPLIGVSLTAGWLYRDPVQGVCV